MAIDRRIGSKLPSTVDRDSTPGTRYDSGPYIGIVKQVHDSTRSGRLQVYIPEIGGPDPDDSKHWRTVSYASPFGGTTNPPPNLTNSYGFTKNTYGFWMVPPDVGSQVLVTFVMGDPSRGYWFACVSPDISTHMTPAVGSVTQDQLDPNSVADMDKFIPGGYKDRVVAGNKFPVTEFNINNENAYSGAVDKVPKPIHPFEFKKLVDQGLEGDAARGTISSSSQRETPSAVFGFSTPGKRITGETAGKNDSDSVAYARLGGHTFVMDDGEESGQNQLIRLRTAGGHQILMNDSEGSIYISNMSGHSWFEMTASGQIFVYSSGGISMRTKGSLNFHADRNIAMNAGGSFILSAAKAFAAEAPMVSLNGKSALSLSGIQTSIKGSAMMSVSGGGMTSIGASGAVKIGAAMVMINGGFPGTPPLPPKDLPRQSLADAQFVSPGWQIQEGALSTICSVAPTHEPFKRSNRAATDTVEVDVTVDENGNEVSKVNPGTPVGPTDAAGAGVTKGAPESSLLKQPDPQGSIGNLDKDGVKAYMAQTGYSESNGNYEATNQYGYLGKYQMGAGALADQGYVKPGTTQAGLSDPNNWTGKDGLNGPSDFLSNPGVQEKTMYDYTTRNYNSLVAKGIITKDTSAEDTAGYLSTSHLLGAGGTAKWYSTGSGADANGTTGTDYFNRGRYSQVVLANTGNTGTA